MPSTPIELIDNHPLAESLFELWRDALGKDATAYRNHVYRVLNFACAIKPVQGEALDKLVIAGVFHDLGIWSDHTFDYLDPSIERACEWLREHGHEAWVPAITAIILEHHKIRRYRGEHAALVEPFRKADWTDVCLGLLHPGISKPVVRQVRRHFPNAGFHKRLVQLSFRQFLRKPWRPMPMLRW